MPGSAFRFALPLALLAGSAGAQPVRTAAAGDYDVDSSSWNGLSTLTELAAAEGVRLEPSDVLDFGRMGPTDGLLVIHPTGAVPEADILRLLAAGGRVAIADDFGTAATLLQRLGVVRSETGPTGGDHLHGNRALPVARPRTAHALAEGVDALVTNHAAALSSDIDPVFDYGDPAEAAVVAGAAGDDRKGRIVLVGDASVFINNMLEHPGNRTFAQNLLHYLAAGGGRVVLVHGEFASIGRAGGVTGPLSPPELIPAFNTFLADLASAKPSEPVLRFFGLLVVSFTFLGVLFLVPLGGHRYDGRWLRPAYVAPAAGFLGKVQIFRGKRASYLYPALVLRRDLEVRLIEALALRAPITVNAIVDALARRGVPPGPRAELRWLFLSLDRLQVRADRASMPPRVSARRLGVLADAAERVLRLAEGIRPRHPWDPEPEPKS